MAAAVVNLFPDTDAWGIVTEPEQPLPLAYAAGDGALFGLELHPLEEGEMVADVEVERFSLEKAEVKVVQRLVQGSYQEWARSRTWSFSHPGGREVTLETMETSDDGPNQLEKLARGAAHEAGWRIVSPP